MRNEGIGNPGTGWQGQRLDGPADASRRPDLRPQTTHTGCGAGCKFGKALKKLHAPQACERDATAPLPALPDVGSGNGT